MLLMCARLAQSVEHQTFNLRVAVQVPHRANPNFILTFFLFDFYILPA